MFGVVTVKRMSECVPGVTPPSCTLQKSAGRSSTRFTQLFCVLLESTMRSGRSPVYGTPLERDADGPDRAAVGESLGVQAASATSSPAATTYDEACFICLPKLDVHARPASSDDSTVHPAGGRRKMHRSILWRHCIFLL